MAGYVPPITPAVDKWNVEQSVGAGRSWDGPGVRYNSATVAQPYTMPNSSEPELARALMIMTGSGNVTIKQADEVGGGTVTINNVVAPCILRLVTTQVTAVTGTIADIYWLS